MATLSIKNLPEPLYEKLKARAREERRSVAAEAAHLLSVALDIPEPLSILELQGLGHELWRGTGATRHVETERASWD